MRYHFDVLDGIRAYIKAMGTRPVKVIYVTEKQYNTYKRKHRRTDYSGIPLEIIK